MAPGLRVMLNGNEVATVSTEGMLMLAVRIGGTRIDPEIATFDISGMSAGPDGEPAGHPWWALCEPLRVGDVMRIELIPDATTSRQPDPELDDPADEKEAAPMPSRQEVIAHAASQPFTHDAIRFQFTDHTGTVSNAETLPTEHGMALSVLWNWLHTDRANVSLHCYDLDYLDEKNPGRDLARFKLAPGQGVTLKLM